MSILYQPTTLTFIGIALITILAIGGAILSRVMNFNYSNLTIFSIAIYIGIAMQVASHAGKSAAIIATVALGIYDAIAGWELALKFNANFGVFKDEMEKMSIHTRIIGTVIFSILLGFIGYWIAV